MGSVVARLFLGACLASCASRGAAASTSPLHEISHVGSLDTVCSVVVVHANAAIAATLHDDASLERAATTLHAIDLERGSPGRRTGLAELARLTADVNDGTARGVAEVKRLRTLAGDAKDPHEASALNDFARALDSALNHQHRLSLDLEAFLRFIEYEDMRDVAPLAGTGSADSAATDVAEMGGQRRSAGGAPEGPYQAPGRTETGMARSAAADFDIRLLEVTTDEAHAADRTSEAITGC